MPIDPMILSIIMLVSRAFEVPAPLIAAIIDQESGWNVNALGDRDEDQMPHSFGLMQVNDRGAGFGYPQDLLLTPAGNILVGSEYLKACLDMYPNNVRLAISAYNQGMAGAARRGYGYNEPYVNNVLSLWEKYKKELR